MAQVSVCSQINTKHININPLQTKRRLLYLKTQSVPRSKHFSSRYENQSVYAVSGTSLCLFSDKYKTHKYSVGKAYSCWMLNCWFITWPVGFKMLNSCIMFSIHFRQQIWSFSLLNFKNKFDIYPLVCCSFFEAWLQVTKPFVRNYYWKLCERNGAWFGTWLGEGLAAIAVCYFNVQLSRS